MDPCPCSSSHTTIDKFPNSCGDMKPVFASILLICWLSNVASGFINLVRRRSSKTTLNNSRIEPKFTVGVIADIQYAPIPDGTSYAGIPRFYQHALVGARVAADYFQSQKVSLVLNLGDTIDGKCQMIEQEGGQPLDDPGVECLGHVLEALSPYQHGPMLHTYGNHELYNLNREQIGTMMGIPFVVEDEDELVGYQSYSHNGIRFIILDTMDISFMRPEGSRKRRLADAILTKENPNFPAVENSPQGLEGNQKRFVAFNGAVDKPQLQWLRTTLQEARDENEKVVLMSHQPILPDSCSPVTLVWNYDDVLTVLRDFSDVVVLSLAGHAHKGGYKRDDQSGIHFRVVEAVLETPSPDCTYCTLDVYDDKIHLQGYGECRSATYDFEHCTKAATTN
jgi:manganese-dependent ADP-ribose/CDP-alcohol diphosphatase